MCSLREGVPCDEGDAGLSQQSDEGDPHRGGCFPFFFSVGEVEEVSFEGRMERGGSKREQGFNTRRQRVERGRVGCEESTQEKTFV